MPYAIKGPDGTLVHVEVDESKEFTWEQFRAATGSMTDEAGWKKKGYTCVPVTVSEGDAETLLRRLRGFLADPNHHTRNYIESGEQSSDLHEWVLEIDAYLQGGK